MRVLQAFERRVVLQQRVLAAHPHMQFKEQELMDQAAISSQGPSTAYASACTIPETFSGPHIPREYEYRFAHDDQYRVSALGKKSKVQVWKNCYCGRCALRSLYGRGISPKDARSYGDSPCSYGLHQVAYRLLQIPDRSYGHRYILQIFSHSTSLHIPNIHLSTVAGERRIPIAKNALITLKHYYAILKSEGSKIASHKGIVTMGKSKTARHAISGRNFDESLDQNAAGRLKPVDPNIAALLGHSEEVQARHYVDSWAKSAVKGYRIVKLLAERQKGLFGADIAAAERRVKFMGFSKVAMQLSDAEAEEDCGEREPYSQDEEDAAVASDSSGFVPSRPTRRSPFEFLDDAVTEEHSSSEVSTHWRLIALDRVHWPAMRRRQMVARDANLDRSNPPMTAERLLLWVGIQSKLLLQLDTTHGLDSFAAYKASRIVMCPENAHRYDPSNEVIPFDADNQLSKLLMAAYGDAYHRKRKASVVIVLKPAVGIAAVVLLGEAISPSSPQRKKFTNDGDGAQRSNPRWDTKADQPLLKKPRTRSTTYTQIIT
ncbi:hypothetical protein OSTOST_03538 [Ostertagia ostertagi]